MKQLHTLEGYTDPPVRNEEGAFDVLNADEYLETSVRAHRID